MGIEYLPTDLPRYVKTTARTALANSVVADGHVLLFSEDGETLTAKKPDGSFAEIGGGSGGVEFYKCTGVVTPVAGIPQGQTLQMQGQDITLESAKGITFTQEDATKKGRERTWISSDGAYRLINKEDEDQASGEHIWYIISVANTSYNAWTSINCTGSTSVNPWDLTEMVDNANGMSYALTWTVSEGTEGTPATWNGYKATMSDEGGYVFADTATTGLSYADGLTPQVGTIYSQDAKVKVAQILEAGTAIPQDGLIMYMPFDGTDDVKVGTLVSKQGGVTFGSQAGIKYGIFDGSTSFVLKTTEGDTKSHEYTIVCYAKGMFDSGNTSIGYLLAHGMPMESGEGSNYGSKFYVASNGGVAGITTLDGAVTRNNWNFFCWRSTSRTNNAVRVNQRVADPWTGESVGAFDFIGGNPNSYRWVGYIFDCAVYNRYLTDAEVEALYKRVIPLQA